MVKRALNRHWPEYLYEQVHREMNEEFEARYEEAQARLRMSCLCRATRRKLSHPLKERIIELALELNND